MVWYIREDSFIFSFLSKGHQMVVHISLLTHLLFGEDAQNSTCAYLFNRPFRHQLGQFHSSFPIFFIRCSSLSMCPTSSQRVESCLKLSHIRSLQLFQGCQGCTVLYDHIIIEYHTICIYIYFLHIHITVCVYYFSYSALSNNSPVLLSARPTLTSWFVTSKKDAEAFGCLETCTGFSHSQEIRTIEGIGFLQVFQRFLFNT